MTPRTASASVTSTSLRRGRVRSWRPSEARARSVPSWPHPPKTRMRTGGSAALGGAPLSSAVLPPGLGEDIAVAAHDLDGLLEELHPLDVVVAGVGEVGEASRPDLLDHVPDRLLDRDLRAEAEGLLHLLGGDSVAPDHPR